MPKEGSLGTFSAGWNLTKDGYTLWYNASSGTVGIIATPRCQVNGKLGGNVRIVEKRACSRNMLALTVIGDRERHEITFSL